MRYLLTVVLLFACLTARAQISIVYDNDVHCAIEGYAAVAAVRDSLLQLGGRVATVSSGDFVSGSTVGACSRGEYPIRVMNVVGYDVVTLGNHEFDYKVDGARRFDSLLKAKVVCCNFCHAASGAALFQPYTMVGDVAFVGVATPSTVSSTSPCYYMNGEKLLYTFGYSVGREAEFFGFVQRCVDKARRHGAKHVVVLSHLGDCDDDPTSLQLIANTRGIDAVLDGHSHSVIECRRVANREGDSVLLSSTGTKLKYIGLLTFATDGTAATRLIATNGVRYASQSARRVADTIAAITREFTSLTGHTVGHNDRLLRATDSAGTRITRLRPTDIGLFCAEALRATQHADIGWVNGGGIRADLPAGDITIADLLSVMPFGNSVCVAKVTGRALWGALEQACRMLPATFGGYPQLSGMTFEADATKPSCATVGSDGVSHAGEPGAGWRVSNVRVYDSASGTYQPIVLDRYYTVASSSYVLRKNGDGLSFDGIELLRDNAGLEIEALAEYLKMINK